MADTADSEASQQPAGLSAGLVHFAPRRDAPGALGDPQPAPAVITFNREELRDILNLYGRKVAAGDWRDYAIDFGRERAVFLIFRRAAETPLFRIEKEPKLAQRQGAFSVTNAAGLILKRGHELAKVLRVLDKDRFKLLAE